MLPSQSTQSLSVFLHHPPSLPDSPAFLPRLISPSSAPSAFKSALSSPSRMTCPNCRHPQLSEGSAFLPVGPGANPVRSLSSTRRALLDTQEPSQPLSHHALAHTFRHISPSGANPSTQRLRLSAALTPTRLATSHSPLVSVLLFSYSYALLFAAQSAIPNPFNTFRILCQRHPGSHPSNQRVWGFPASLSDHDSRNTNRSPYPLLATRHSPPVAAPALFLLPATIHQSQVTKSFRIRTSRKQSRNPSGMNTSKTKDLKPCRINTSEKRGGGGGCKGADRAHP